MFEGRQAGEQAETDRQAGLSRQAGLQEGGRFAGRQSGLQAGRHVYRQAGAGRQTDTDRDRQACLQAGRHVYRQVRAGRQTGRKAGSRQACKQAVMFAGTVSLGRQAWQAGRQHRHVCRQAGMLQTGRQAGRQAGRQTDTQAGRFAGRQAGML